MSIIHESHSLKSPCDRSPQILKWWPECCSNRPPFSLQLCLGSAGAPAEPSLQCSTGGLSAQKGLASTLNEAQSDCTELCCWLFSQHRKRLVHDSCSVFWNFWLKCSKDRTKSVTMSQAPSKHKWGTFRWGERGGGLAMGSGSHC